MREESDTDDLPRNLYDIDINDISYIIEIITMIVNIVSIVHYITDITGRPPLSKHQ